MPRSLPADTVPQLGNIEFASVLSPSVLMNKVSCSISLELRFIAPNARISLPPSLSGDGITPDLSLGPLVQLDSSSSQAFLTECLN